MISVFHAINFWCIFFILDLGKLFYFLPKAHSKYSKTLFKLGIFFPYIRNGSIKFFQKNSSHDVIPSVKLSLISIYINTFKFQTEPSLHAKKKRKNGVHSWRLCLFTTSKTCYIYFLIFNYVYTLCVYKSKYLFYERTLTRNGASYFSYWTLYQYS